MHFEKYVLFKKYTHDVLWQINKKGKGCKTNALKRICFHSNLISFCCKLYSLVNILKKKAIGVNGGRVAVKPQTLFFCCLCDAALSNSNFNEHFWKCLLSHLSYMAW